MQEAEFETLKAKFFEIFASVPLPLRKEIIAVIDDAPVSWAAANAELLQNTPKARKILEQLKKIGVL
jgi:hypothetical protein